MHSIRHLPKLPHMAGVSTANGFELKTFVSEPALSADRMGIDNDGALSDWTQTASLGAAMHPS
jgi:hypothetical protein